MALIGVRFLLLVGVVYFATSCFIAPKCLQCARALPHQVASGDRFPPEEYTTINAERLARIRPGQTGEDELLEIFQGQYHRQMTMNPPMPLPRNQDTRLHRIYIFRDVAFFTRDLSGGGYQIKMHGWHHRIFLAVYISDGVVISYSTSHDERTDEDEIVDGPLNGEGQGFIMELSDTERGCIGTYYRVVTYYDRRESADDLKECWWFDDYQQGRL
ncbi:MAG: hypothetical protein RH862_19245 [Leptospiraceae bacterium]